MGDFALRNRKSSPYLPKKKLHSAFKRKIFAYFTFVSYSIMDKTSFSLIGRAGFDLNFTRTYNSKSYESSVMGYGWTFTGNEKLFLNIKGTANLLNYQDEDGTDHELTYDGSTATYYSGPGKYLTIQKISTESSTIV